MILNDHIIYGFQSSESAIFDNNYLSSAIKKSSVMNKNEKTWKHKNKLKSNMNKFLHLTTENANFDDDGPSYQCRTVKLMEDLSKSHRRSQVKYIRRHRLMLTHNYVFNNAVHVNTSATTKVNRQISKSPINDVSNNNKESADGEPITT